MYSLPSTSQILEPAARSTKNGTRPRPRKARTGELTPPGMCFSASWKSSDERAAIREIKTRRGRESNPRIEVLQTPTLPLGSPAIFGERETRSVRSFCQRNARNQTHVHRSAMSLPRSLGQFHRGQELFHPKVRGLTKHLERELNNSVAQFVTLKLTTYEKKYS